MIKNELEISIKKKIVIVNNRKQVLSFENDFLVQKWGPNDIAYSIYSCKELVRLHKTFGHPTVSEMGKLLKISNQDEYDPTVRSELETICKCATCAKHSSKSRKFNFSKGTDGLRFNHIVEIGVMTLNGKSVFHAVVEAANFTSEVF